VLLKIAGFYMHFHTSLTPYPAPSGQ